jgi:hypothetical protein
VSWSNGILQLLQNKENKMARSFDLIIKNGRVLDGTGSPYFKGDIGIKNSKLESNRLYMVNGIFSREKLS